MKIVTIITAIVLAGTAVMALFLMLNTPARAHEEPAARLSFHSFDGGGPVYRVQLDSDIVAVTENRRYHHPDHAKMRGAGYDKIFIFTGKKPGETVLLVTEEMQHGNPRTRHTEHLYRITVSEDLRVTIRALPEDSRVKVPQTDTPDRSVPPVSPSHN